MRNLIKIKALNLLTRLIWLVAMAGTGVLLAAGLKISERQKCSGIAIHIINSGKNPFVTKADIALSILRKKSINPLGRDVRRINLMFLKSRLETNPWIRHAQIFLDNENILHIRVTQRVPMIRVFTSGNGSFYLDSAGYRLPALPELNPDLPIFTDYSLAGPKTPFGDSSLLSGILKTGRFLQQDSFWNAQVEQVNILDKDNLELIPLVGSQVILFGTPVRIKEKFRDLLAFYRQVLNSTNWERYDTINISYPGEIVCVRSNRKSTSVSSVKKVVKLPEKKAELPLKVHRRLPKAIYYNPDIHHSSLQTIKNIVSHD